MKRQVWKYPIDVGENRITMPKGAKILTAQMQRDTPVLWAEVNVYDKHEELACESRNILVTGTGHDIDRNLDLQYIATFQMSWMVWHVYEIKG